MWVLTAKQAENIDYILPVSGHKIIGNYAYKVRGHLVQNGRVQFDNLKPVFDPKLIAAVKAKLSPTFWVRKLIKL